MVLASCRSQTLEPFRRIKVLHFTDDFYLKKNRGKVKGEVCRHNAKLTTNLDKWNKVKLKDGTEISLRAAMEKIEKQKGGLAYLVDVSRDDKSTLAKQCIIVRGKGFK